MSVKALASVHVIPKRRHLFGINNENGELSLAQKLHVAEKRKNYVDVLRVRFPILHKKLSDISLPCLLLLFKHSYCLLVFGVGPAICHLTLYWVPFTCGLAQKAEPFQVKLLALDSQDGVARAVSYLGYGWTRVELQGSDFKRKFSFIFIFIIFSQAKKWGITVNP